MDVPDLTGERAGGLLVAVLGGDLEVTAKGLLHGNHVERRRRDDDLWNEIE